MWFIKIHETVNCNSTLRQQCFLSSFSSAQLLPCSGISNLTRVGWLLQLLGWPFITCFFRIDGLWRVFVWLWLNFCCQCRIKPFFPALFLLCSALSRPSWLLQLFAILGLHFCWVYCRLSWLLCWSFCLRQVWLGSTSL